MVSALWLGSMEPQWLAPFLSLPVQVMVTPEMMVPVLPGQRFFTPSDDRETLGHQLGKRRDPRKPWPPAGFGAGPAAPRQPCGFSCYPAG